MRTSRSRARSQSTLMPLGDNPSFALANALIICLGVTLNGAVGLGGVSCVEKGKGVVRVRPPSREGISTPDKYEKCGPLGARWNSCLALPRPTTSCRRGPAVGRYRAA